LDRHKTMIKTQAIILKKVPTNEYDQLITCYTQELGKITAIAKSILKKSSIQAMHLDLFNLVNFELVNGNGFPIITGAEAIDAHSKMRSSIKYLSAAFVLGEYIDKLTFEYLRDDDLWNFGVDALSQLNSGVEDIPGFLKASQKKLLEVSGYNSDFDSLSTDHNLHLALENIAGQRLKAITFFHRVNSLPDFLVLK